jgi:hypothetical protein
MINKVNDLLNKIKELPGHKIITLTVEDSDFICEMKNENFTDNSVIASFVAKLVRGLVVGGGMTVIQVLDNKKVIYGFVLGEDKWFSIPAEDMQKIRDINHETGEPLPREIDVDFCDFYL